MDRTKVIDEQLMRADLYTLLGITVTRAHLCRLSDMALSELVGLVEQVKARRERASAIIGEQSN